MSVLRKAVHDYLEMRRSLGYKLGHYEGPLLDFAGYFERTGEPFVSSPIVMNWLSSGASDRNQANRLGIVRGFADYFRSFEPRTTVPPMAKVRRRNRRPMPFIYKDKEIRALIAASRELKKPARAELFSTLLGLLAVTGLRISEALNLDRGDFDAAEGILLVRDAKFGKSRRVPVHKTTVAALKAYADNRDRLLPRARSESFFLSSRGKRPFKQNLYDTFTVLLGRVGLPTQPKRRPRLHDLRHTFAVRTLMDWFQSGADVQALLPVLSTYLGHVCPSCTYWYLTAVPELVCEAAKRLEHHTGGQQ